MKKTSWKGSLYEIIFEHHTFAGKMFDLLLLLCILLSIAVVCLESMDNLRSQYGDPLRAAEWSLTVLFTIEYLARIAAVKSPRSYILSFFGIIDLMSIAPTYISLFLTGTQSLMVVRALRLLRIFRILKLTQFVGEGDLLIRALRASRNKIVVFTMAVSSLVLILGAMMYVIEGEEHGFTSIPRGVYWAIVTLTTVGYGDITPKTALGQGLSSLVMLLGYGIIAIPTGIVGSEIRKMNLPLNTKSCQRCLADRHDPDAVYCKCCGERL
jgi:voltage-gated potassium channel